MDYFYSLKQNIITKIKISIEINLFQFFNKYDEQYFD